MNLRAYFDRVVCINLKRREDRWHQFQEELERCHWCFKTPERFDAIDGSLVPCPPGWQSGGGAWGCMESHRQILERAIMDGVSSLLVLEDDAIFCQDFAQEVERFLVSVPPDWDQLMLGGQHITSALPVSEGVVRCANCQRTHCYAIRGAFLRELYRHWCGVGAEHHCDWIMGPLQADWQVYAPCPFLVGQDRSMRDICGRINPRKFWKSAEENQPLIVLHAPKEVLQELREKYAFHSGYNRDPDTDIDVGLIEVFKAENRQLELWKWLHMIQEEVASGNGQVACVWHPEATYKEVKDCTKHPVIEVAAQTTEEVLNSLQCENKLILA